MFGTLRRMAATTIAAATNANNRIANHQPGNRRKAAAVLALFAVVLSANASKAKRLSVNVGWFSPWSEGREAFIVRNVVNGAHNDRVCGEVLMEPDGFQSFAYTSGGSKSFIAGVRFASVSEAEAVVKKACD
jgi:hypothetical protein